jgi:hypothetical protein
VQVYFLPAESVAAGAVFFSLESVSRYPTISVTHEETFIPFPS